MDACNGWTCWRRPTGDRPWAPAHAILEPPRYATCHFHREPTTTRRGAQNSTGYSRRRRTGDPSHPRVPVTPRAGGGGRPPHPGPQDRVLRLAQRPRGWRAARRRAAITRLYGWSLNGMEWTDGGPWGLYDADACGGAPFLRLGFSISRPGLMKKKLFR